MLRVILIVVISGDAYFYQSKIDHDKKENWNVIKLTIN